MPAAECGINRQAEVVARFPFEVDRQSRKRATIVRKGDPAVLNFEQIKNLAAQWNERLVPID